MRNDFNVFFNCNIISCFYTQKTLLNECPHAKGWGGAVVNVSSIAASTGSPNEYLDYAASKGAIDSLTPGLSKEVADEGIRVNEVRPCFIYIDIHARGGEANRVGRIKDSLPMKREVEDEDVLNAILWLLSEEASFSNGTFIDITGSDKKPVTNKQE
jgi:NAD(P)-dependent dehydrogenase (short-subunit alcohol dehydrogenase family)